LLWILEFLTEDESIWTYNFRSKKQP
jgi:hypothetical protein